MIHNVYLHFPFCLRKCGYCSFYSINYTRESSEDYIRYVVDEINAYSTLIAIKPQTLYFGGGTPSLMTLDQVVRVMDCFDLSELAECTLEANPTTIERKKLAELKAHGVNRLSIGFQSFRDRELQFLERLHTSEDNYRVFRIARDSGFDNISVDLMFGLPGQRLEDLVKSIDAIMELNPEHISTYCLSIEDATSFARKGIKLPADEITARFYRYIRERLQDDGYEQYEISNFSRRGYMSQHNLNYWHNSKFIGFGVSAHSNIGDFRYHNPSNMKDYCSLQQDDRLYPNREDLDKLEQRKEFIINALRLSKGLDIEKFNRLFATSFCQIYQKSLEKHNKFLDIENGFLKLKSDAYFVSNEIIMDFID